METIKEIIGNSAIGNASKVHQTFVLSVFASIVIISFTMLVIILNNAQQINIGFGY